MTTLTEHLRALSDDRLTALLRARPDLLVPVPGDLSSLAVRAQSRLSVARALDSLDRFTLEIVDAMRLSRTQVQHAVAMDGVFALTSHVPPERVRAAVDLLRERALVYGPDTAPHLVAAVDEVGSPYPAGLGRPAAELSAGAGSGANAGPAADTGAGTKAAALCADAAALRRAVLAAPPAARAVLDRLAAGPPVGRLNGTGPERDGEARAALAWLVEHHLLVPVGGGTAVELPREVGLLLRQRMPGGPLGPLHPDPPTGAVTRRDPHAVDSAGAGQVMEVVRQVEALLDALAVDPPPVLRSGGMGVRDLRRLARTAALTDGTAALLLEVCWAAGLVAETDPEAASAPAYLPTTGYDHWRTESLAARWARLATAWLVMTRQPALAGQRDDRDRLLAVFSPELVRTGAATVRALALGVPAGLAEGAAPTLDEVMAILSWQSPRRFPPEPNGDRGPAADLAPETGPAAETRPATQTRPVTENDPRRRAHGQARTQAVRWALGEAATLGVAALGALTSYGRLLLAETLENARRDPDEDPLGTRAGGGEGDGASAVRALDALLPAPVDHLLVQADLTIVVPGPPEPALGAELDLLADQESAGGAAVYRVTPASVRRALDAGYSGADLHHLFARRSRTPVPQALEYLIDDTARRHGGLRVGSGAYLRAEDPALLSELLADRRLSGLSLRRLAPTVLVTPHHPSRLLAVLRDNGYAPTGEDASGSMVLNRPRARRAPTRHPAAVRAVVTNDPLAAGPRLPAARLAGVVAQLRRGDDAARSQRRAPVTVRESHGPARPQAHAQALAVLQQAVRERRMVWVGYVDAHGATTSRLVRPVSIGAGYLRAEDERAETVHTFRLERITAAVAEDAKT